MSSSSMGSALSSGSSSSVKGSVSSVLVFLFFLWRFNQVFFISNTLICNCIGSWFEHFCKNCKELVATVALFRFGDLRFFGFGLFSFQTNFSQDSFGISF